MGVTDDHIHEIEVTVHGAQVVHRHSLVFVGVPGDVGVRHRSYPVSRPVLATEGEFADAVPEPLPDWAEIDTGEWDWLPGGEDDTPSEHDA